MWLFGSPGWLEGVAEFIPYDTFSLVSLTSIAKQINAAGWRKRGRRAEDPFRGLSLGWRDLLRRISRP
jgi:hypothetical protein